MRSASGIMAAGLPMERPPGEAHIATTTAMDEVNQIMPTTKRKPATVGEILVEEFMQPMSLTQAALAAAMGMQRKHVNELSESHFLEAHRWLVMRALRRRHEYGRALDSSAWL